MSIDDTLPQVHFSRPNVLDLAPEYEILRAQAPLVMVRTPAGDPAWLATRYHTAKQLFADDRLGRSHPDPENAPRLSRDSTRFGGPEGDYETEKELHNMHRKLLVPTFSARRMRLLAEHVDNLADETLTRLAGLTPPVDLHENLSFPFPIVVICELLGVPLEDRDKFRVWSWDFASLVDRERAFGAALALHEYMNAMVESKRKEPGDDLITDLISAAPAYALLSDEEIADVGVNLLFGGHETTGARLDYGTLLLLTNPEQRQALQGNPDLLESAVEEIMRMSVPLDDTMPRYAHADIEIADVTIRAGELVLIPPSVANRDETVFPDPNRFDISRKSEFPHLGFGHGIHFCIGAALARLELRTIFGKLFQRFPDLDLAVPFEELQLNTDRFSGGLRELPVSW